MFTSFQSFLREKKLFQNKEKTLLGLSAGVDSMVMLHLFSLTNIPFGIAHCHFSLRPEAEQEALFVENLAHKLDVPFYFRQFDTKAFAQSTGISTLMAARQHRYAFFEEVQQKFGYKYIATAHHLDDNLETILLNLVRGSGISGLRGILAQKNKLIRPLLFASKQEILAFAQKEGIIWWEDSSNASTKYKRNFLRHKVIPLLKELNPNLLESFNRTLEKLQFTEQAYKKSLRRAEKRYIKKQGEISYVDLQKPLERTLLYEIIKKWGFSWQQSQDMLASESIGNDFFSATHWAVLDRKQLVICPISYQNTAIAPVEVPINGILETDWFRIETKIIENTAFENLEKSQDIAYLAYEKLSFPLYIRLWQKGEKFIPYGMRQSKKVSDFLRDTKIPKNIKNRIFVVLSKNEIVYLAGLRSSNAFCVEAQSQQILEIRYQSL